MRVGLVDRDARVVSHSHVSTWYRVRHIAVHISGLLLFTWVVCVTTARGKA